MDKFMGQVHIDANIRKSLVFGLSIEISRNQYLALITYTE